MGIYIDPVSRKRILFQPGTTDLVYDAEGDSSVSDEVIPVIGPWTDYTGSGGIDSRQQQMWGGVENEFFGTDPQLTGENKDNLGNVGQRLGTTRIRRIKKYVDLKKV